MSYKKIVVTNHQLECLRLAADNLSAIMGLGGGFDDDAVKIVRSIDRMLKKNNLPPRRFK